MIKSMTGFGFYEDIDDICMQYWEVKSVNSKNLNVKFKIPSFLKSVEHIWLKEVKNKASRGNIEIYLNLKILKKTEIPFSINEGLLDFLFDFLNSYAQKRGDIFAPDYNKITSIPHLWIETPISATSNLVESLSKGLSNALDSWNSFREREGKNLAEDLLERIKFLVEIKSRIEKISSFLVEEKFELLKKRVKELTERAGVEVDEERFLQELALLADRLDISEELTRLGIHLDEMNKVITQGGIVGRKLDFLCQECFREINTCGNKAQNAEVSKLVVEFKTELEKVREQVQNLE